MSESAHQRALFEWAAIRERELPELAMLVHVPNGGLRHPAVAKMLKREGVKPGFPDLLLLIPRGKYHGFVGEMKFGRNRLTEKQREWKSRLEAAGYYFVMAHRWENMAAEIERYLSGRV